MTTPLLFGTDASGKNAFAPVPTLDMQSVQLSANTAKTVTVPQNLTAHSKVIVSIIATPGTEVWVDFTGTTAALPSSSVAATTSSLNQSPRYIPVLKYNGTTNLYVANTFSIITPNTNSNVSIQYWTAGQAPGN